MISLTNNDSSEGEQWGCYNLPKYIYHKSYLPYLPYLPHLQDLPYLHTYMSIYEL